MARKKRKPVADPVEPVVESTVEAVLSEEAVSTDTATEDKTDVVQIVEPEKKETTVPIMPEPKKVNVETKHPVIATFEKMVADYKAFDGRVEARVAKFVEIMRYVLRNPRKEVLEILFGMFYNIDGIVGGELFHSYLRKANPRAAASNDILSFTHTIFEQVARSIRRKKEFPFDVNACRLAIKNDAVVDFLIAKLHR